MLIVSLDQYIVIVALPDIGRALGYSVQTLQLVVSAYAIASSGFLLFGGRATDLLGRRRVLAAGLVLYGLASFAGGAATSPAAQLAARFVQGVGGALVFPATLAVINTTYEQGQDRNRALSIWGASGAAGLVVGVLFGGLLTRAFGWSSVFYVNVPLAAAVLLGLLVVAPKDPARETARRFDLAGALTATAAVVCVVWALVRGPEFGWSTPTVLGPVVGGVAFAALFAAVEHRAIDPLLPTVLVTNAFVRLSVMLAFMFMATFGSLLYFVSIYLQDVLNYDALQTGLGFLAPTVAVVVASALAGPISTRVGLKVVCIGALSVGALGALALWLAMRADSRYVDLLPGLLLISIGDGLMFTAMFIAAAIGVAPSSQGVASAISSTGAGTGAAIGLALLMMVANPGNEFVDPEAVRVATAEGIRSAVLAIACGIAATICATFALYPHTPDQIQVLTPRSPAPACGPSAGITCPEGEGKA
ncbi:MFS transporter [Actinomycetospora sp. CA-101289]|uniref:MFS transporter n=1 Tax=Actinomycetospora sp. CA-101289 TaxID=3239893 RepID=UPI003D97DCB2